MLVGKGSRKCYHWHIAKVAKALAPIPRMKIMSGKGIEKSKKFLSRSIGLCPLNKKKSWLRTGKGRRDRI